MPITLWLKNIFKRSLHPLTKMFFIMKCKCSIKIFEISYTNVKGAQTQNDLCRFLSFGCYYSGSKSKKFHFRLRALKEKRKEVFKHMMFIL